MMKHKVRWTIVGTVGLSFAIGLGISLAACSALPTSTPVPGITSVQPATNQPPTALPPTQPPALPTSTSAAVDAAVTPAADLATALPCRGQAALTPAQTEGPYYTPNSPERISLIEPGMSGARLVVTGYVLTTDCRPVTGAWLDFWQADDQGVYDNTGYRLRGHLFADETGRYTLETIMPGEYPGRTPHIHVKVRAPNGPVLTSQIYFPGVAANERDSIFDPALLADVQDTADGKVATFNFVVK